MKAAVLYGHKDLRVEEISEPQIFSDEVLIRVKYSGICGTDMHLYEGKWKVNEGKVILGHEFSGIIEKKGKEVVDFSIGDGVVVDPNITCGHCHFCRRSDRNYYCINRKVIGYGGWMNGGFAELVRAPQKVVYELPKGISFDEAALVEPVACALRGVDRVQVKSGDKVLILGAGPMGLLMLQIVRIVGASWIGIADIIDNRLQRAKNMGADCVINSAKEDIKEIVMRESNGLGADVVIEAAGSVQALKQTTDLICRGGRICVFGVIPPGDLAEINPFELYYKEATMVASFCNPFTFQRSLNLLASKRIKVRRLITHTFSLDEINKAFCVMLKEKNRCKVMIKFN